MTEKSKFGHFSSPNVQVTTLEGLLQRTITGLSQDQPIRRALHPDDAEKIDQYIERVEQLLSVSKPFELTVVDPSGNSWVENPHAPAADSGRVEEWFERSREEDNLLGHNIYDATPDHSILKCGLAKSLSNFHLGESAPVCRTAGPRK